MIASRSAGVRPAAFSARSVAAWASPAPVSPSRTQRRSWLPVRVRIHSSLVSMSWERSSLVTTRSGTANPVPRKRARIMIVPGWSIGSLSVPPASRGPQQPDPAEPRGGERPAHCSPGLPHYAEWREPAGPAAVRAEPVALHDLRAAESSPESLQQATANRRIGLLRHRHEVPDHARGAPAVAVARADHEPIGPPRECRDRVAPHPRHLVGLG